MNKKICIIGLGYVGLPLAHAFSKKYQVVGFDINRPRVDELSSGYDRTLELTSEEVKESISNSMIYSKEPNINPIGDFIEICDEFFITIDSTSMLSEVRANSNAKINIIELESKKKNSKYHKLANIIASINKKVDFKKILEKVEI